MSLALHIVRKDLLRMRLPMALWALTFAWQFALGIRLLHGATPDLSAFTRIQLYDWLAFDIQVAVSYVLVATLIHEDPLVGSSAFWPTRPISGARLLMAKLAAFLAIFGAFPILLTLPWWLYCGYGLHDVWWAALHTFCVSLLAPLVALMVATLTGNMSRFLACSILLLAFLAITFTTFSLAEPVFNRPKALVRPEDVSAGFRVLMDIGLLGFPLVAAHQFVTRRTIRSLVLLGCVLGSMVFVESRNPFVPHFYDLIRGPSLPRPFYPVDHSVQFSFKGAVLAPAYGEPGDPRYADEFIGVTHLPEGGRLGFGAEATQVWSWADGSRYWSPDIWLQWEQRYQPPDVIPNQPAPRGWFEWEKAQGRLVKFKTYEDYLGFQTVATRDHIDPQWNFGVQIPPEVIARMRTLAPASSIFLRGEFIRWKPRPDFTLRPGEGWEQDGEGLHIGRAAWDAKAKALDVIYVEHHPAWGTLMATDTHRLTRVAATIVNRRLGERAHWANGGNMESTRIGTVSISWSESLWNGPSTWAGADKWDRDLSPDWFNDATVAGYVGEAFEQFESTLSVDPFAFTQRPKSTAGN